MGVSEVHGGVLKVDLDNLDILLVDLEDPLLQEDPVQQRSLSNAVVVGAILVKTANSVLHAHEALSSDCKSWSKQVLGDGSAAPHEQVELLGLNMERNPLRKALVAELTVSLVHGLYQPEQLVRKLIGSPRGELPEVHSKAANSSSTEPVNHCPDSVRCGLKNHLTMPGLLVESI